MFIVRNELHISWAEEALDFCVAFLCKYAKWQNIKGRRLCFLIWMVCGVYWFVVDLHRGLYAQALFCIPTILFQAYGFYEWKRNGFGETKAKASTEELSNPKLDEGIATPANIQ